MQKVQCPDFVISNLQDIAIENGFIDFTFDFKRGSKDGDGFIGIITQIIIKDKNKELSLICKHLKKNPNENENFSLMQMFQREIYIYTKLFPEFERFQREKNISKEDGFWSYPKCYYAKYNEETEEAALILEDLKVRNFRMESKFIPSNYEQTAQIMIQLGRLHALSFAMKEQQPTIFKDFKKLEDVLCLLMQSKAMETLPKKNCELVCSILNNDEIFEKEFFERWKTTLWKEMMQIRNGPAAEPYGVINHGDCWINNFMFNYKENKLNEICLLDWQDAHYGSPFLDIIYFFLLCTTKSFRDNHFDDLIGIYYKSLSDLLRKLGGDPNSQFPWSALQDHIRKFGIIGLGMATFAIPLMTKYVQEYTSNESHDFVEEYSEDYKKRMRGCIEDALKYGFLDKNK